MTQVETGDHVEHNTAPAQGISGAGFDCCTDSATGHESALGHRVQPGLTHMCLIP
jgi:hypothetical protein